MTSLWLISFSLLGAVVTSPAAAATLSGTVQLKDSREPKVKKNREASGVVLWLTAKETPSVKASPLKAQILQRNKRFEPHVLPIYTGGIVTFPNLDPIFHNAFSNYDGKVFDLGLYPPGQTRSVRFDRPGVVRLFCNIHATMSAIIVVVNTPYFGSSQAGGRWEIKDVPPGDYLLSIFHERSTAEVLKALERPVRLPGAGVELSPILISESGYETKPHANKHGMPYPPIDANPVYPGAKR